MEKEFTIVADENYHVTMIAIYELMNKGELNLKVTEIEQLRNMTVAVEKYEDEILRLKPAV